MGFLETHIFMLMERVKSGDISPNDIVNMLEPVLAYAQAVGEPEDQREYAISKARQFDDLHLWNDRTRGRQSK